MQGWELLRIKHKSVPAGAAGTKLYRPLVIWISGFLIEKGGG